jgi:hypothetical protein
VGVGADDRNQAKAEANPEARVARSLALGVLLQDVRSGLKRLPWALVSRRVAGSVSDEEAGQAYPQRWKSPRP